MIDETVVDLMQWVEAKSNERKIGKVDGPQPDPKKKQSWVPKYASLAEILDEYDGNAGEPDAPPIDTAELEALIAEMEAQTDAEF